MVMNKFGYELTVKTRVLNTFRMIFKIPPLERWLLSMTLGKSPSSFFSKLVPMEYLYSEGSSRLAKRHGAVFKLDISKVVDHFVYFGFNDEAFNNLMTFIKEDSIIVDVGANVGRFTLPFASKARNGKVLSFEPDATSFSNLEKNCKLNSFDNITLVNKGLGSKNASFQLFVVNKNNPGMNRILNDGSSHDSCSEIEVVKLDDYLNQLNLDKVDVIKIDVEGFENEVIEGAREVIVKYKPLLFVEMSNENLKEHGSSFELLVKKIEELGYKIVNASTMDVVTESDYQRQIDVICIGE